MVLVVKDRKIVRAGKGSMFLLMAISSFFLDVPLATSCPMVRGVMACRSLSVMMKFCDNCFDRVTSTPDNIAHCPC